MNSIYLKEKDQKILKVFLLWLIFNPLAMASPALHNFSILTHLAMTLLAYNVLGSGFSLLTDLACGLSLYIDPTLIYTMIPLRIIWSKLQANENGFLIGMGKSLVIWLSVFFTMVYCSGDWESDIRNYINILFVKDHSENIGVFWYIFVEVIITEN